MTELMLCDACVDAEHEWKKAEYEWQKEEQEWLAKKPYAHDPEVFRSIRLKMEYESLTHMLYERELEILHSYWLEVFGPDVYYEVFGN